MCEASGRCLFAEDKAIGLMEGQRKCWRVVGQKNDLRRDRHKEFVKHQ